MKKAIPPRVDRYSAWENPPPEPSPRLQYWLDRIAEGWRPNRRLSQLGYDSSAEFYGVTIWEYINVLSPIFIGPIATAIQGAMRLQMDEAVRRISQAAVQAAEQEIPGTEPSQVWEALAEATGIPERILRGS